MFHTSIIEISWKDIYFHLKADVKVIGFHQSNNFNILLLVAKSDHHFVKSEVTNKRKSDETFKQSTTLLIPFTCKDRKSIFIWQHHHPF